MEGNVDKLKTIKLQTYGGAFSELFRKTHTKTNSTSKVQKTSFAKIITYGMRDVRIFTVQNLHLKNRGEFLVNKPKKIFQITDI